VEISPGMAESVSESVAESVAESVSESQVGIAEMAMTTSNTASAGEPSISAGGAEPASDSTNDASCPELPVRLARDRQVLRKIRRLDDPEVLRRVLAGLLNLP
jgi:hypothetical protein